LCFSVLWLPVAFTLERHMVYDPVYTSYVVRLDLPCRFSTYHDFIRTVPALKHDPDRPDLWRGPCCFECRYACMSRQPIQPPAPKHDREVLMAMPNGQLGYMDDGGVVDFRDVVKATANAKSAREGRRCGSPQWVRIPPSPPHHLGRPASYWWFGLLQTVSTDS
jgi:hypothetical protein